MKFSFKFTVDPVNKLLNCEAFGDVYEIVDFELMLKTIVKMAGKHQVKNIVLDSTEFSILCSSVDIAKLLITIEESGFFQGLKIAMIGNPEINIQNEFEGIAEKLSLSIKNFETRSEAMLWLLFNKERE